MGGVVVDQLVSSQYWQICVTLRIMAVVIVMVAAKTMQLFTSWLR